MFQLLHFSDFRIITVMCANVIFTLWYVNNMLHSILKLLSIFSVCFNVNITMQVSVLPYMENDKESDISKCQGNSTRKLKFILTRVIIAVLDFGTSVSFPPLPEVSGCSGTFRLESSRKDRKQFVATASLHFEHPLHFQSCLLLLGLLLLSVVIHEGNFIPLDHFDRDL